MEHEIATSEAPATAVPPSTKRILLMIPCFNEGLNIGRVLQEIRTLGASYDTLVVDDGSSDDTYAVARKLAPTVRLPLNLGIGGAVQTAIKYALEHDYDCAIQIDGDGQHPPDQIRLIVESHRANPTDIVIGSRFLRAGGFRSTWTRRIGISLISAAVKVLYGIRITDPTSGFRLLSRKAIRTFAAEYPHDYPEPISVALAIERGLTIHEVPVDMKSREQGTSSIRGLQKVGYMIRAVGYLVLIRLGRHL